LIGSGTGGGAAIRALRSGDFSAVAALLAGLRGDNLYTARGVRYDVESEPSRAQGARWVADRDGVVGYAVAMRYWWRRTNDAYAWVGVLPEARDQGIGALLWSRVVRHLDALGVDSVVTDVVDDEAGEAFVRSRGFHLDRTDRVSVLDPRTVDLSELPERERRAAAQGYDLVSLGSVQDLHALYELSLATGDDTPGIEAPQIVSFEEWERSMLRFPDLDAEASAVVVKGGVPVSLSLLSVDLASRRARNEETGTAREHRRHGLATLAKLSTVRWAAEHGIQAILTDNAEQNLAMLAINDRLGYRPLIARRRWVKSLRAF
jgi:GNAT superfamily N-acetyltransferase